MKTPRGSARFPDLASTSRLGPIAALALALASLAGCAILPVDRAGRAEADPPPAGANLVQPRREWRFEQDGIRFDNRLPGARLTRVARVDADHYRLSIDPETSPINPSPWFGFRVVSDSPRQVRMNLQYAGYRHRYVPKLSLDGTQWRDASAQEFTVAPNGQASLQVAVSTQPLLVFAQPPLGPEDSSDWMQRLGAIQSVEASEFGRSALGQPLRMLSFGGHRGSPAVLVLGRQHPPEITGSRALVAFVETLASDSAAATEFRERVRVVVVPMLNPDGAVEGHWRGNLHGKDLNRDWGPFAEPETRALRDAMVRMVETEGHELIFAIDFHSTYSDVLYTVEEDPSRSTGGMLRRWIDTMQARFPGRIEEKPYAATTSVFKNWAYCRFGVPAVTYEVGDTTSAALLRQLSRQAAETLVEVSKTAPPRGSSQAQRCESLPVSPPAMPGGPQDAADGSATDDGNVLFR